MTEEEAARHAVPERNGDLAWRRQQKRIDIENMDVEFPIGDQHDSKQRRHEPTRKAAPEGRAGKPKSRANAPNRSFTLYTHGRLPLRICTPASSSPRMWRTYLPNSSLFIMSRVRGRGNSIVSSATTRPGRGDMTITRSARNTDSVIEWVISSTVLCVADQMSRSSRFI